MVDVINADAVENGAEPADEKTLMLSQLDRRGVAVG